MPKDFHAKKDVNGKPLASLEQSSSPAAEPESENAATDFGGLFFNSLEREAELCACEHDNCDSSTGYRADIPPKICTKSVDKDCLLYTSPSPRD